MAQILALALSIDSKERDLGGVNFGILLDYCH